MSETKQDKKRITLRDVAEEAGVSLKTASNVINNSGRMTESTREKVQGVIDRLGYRVNVAAQSWQYGVHHARRAKPHRAIPGRISQSRD